MIKDYIIIRKKKKDEQIENYPIFMAIAEHIGYDATGRKDPINDLDKILEEYHKFEKNPKNASAYSWLVPVFCIATPRAMVPAISISTSAWRAR